LVVFRKKVSFQDIVQPPRTGAGARKNRRYYDKKTQQRSSTRRYTHFLSRCEVGRWKVLCWQTLDFFAGSLPSGYRPKLPKTPAKILVYFLTTQKSLMLVFYIFGFYMILLILTVIVLLMLYCLDFMPWFKIYQISKFVMFDAIKLNLSDLKFDLSFFSLRYFQNTIFSEFNIQIKRCSYIMCKFYSCFVLKQCQISSRLPLLTLDRC